MPSAAEDPITMPPAITGQHGRAWMVDHAAGLRREGIAPERSAVVASFLVEAPWAHPIWHSYYLTLVHLRPTAALPDAVIYLPGATHEFWLLAIDPAHARQEMIATGRVKVLSPLNFAAQIIAASDADALSRIEGTVKLICDGRLSPDTDYLAVWAAMFGDNMLRAAAERRGQ